MIDRRKDDSFLRKVIAGLLIALALESGAFIFLYGKLVDRVEQLEVKVNAIDNIDKTLQSMNSKFIKVETKVDYMVKRVTSLVTAVDTIKNEQSKRTTTVYEAQKHLRTPHYNKGVPYDPNDPTRKYSK